MSNQIVRFVKGQDQSGNKRLMPTGSVRRIVNLHHDKSARLVKRPGREASLGYGSYTRYSVENVMARNGEYLVYGDVDAGFGLRGQVAVHGKATELSSWDEFSDYKRHSTIPSCSPVTEIVVADEPGRQVQCAYDGASIVVAWKCDTSIRGVAFSQELIAQNQPSVILDATSFLNNIPWKLFNVTSSRVGIVWVDAAGGLNLSRIDVGPYGFTPLTHQIGTNAGNGNAIDAAPGYGEFLVAYMSDSGSLTQTDYVYFGAHEVDAPWVQTRRLGVRRPVGAVAVSMAVGNDLSSAWIARRQGNTSFIWTVALDGSDVWQTVTDRVLTQTATSYPRPICFINSTGSCSIADNHIAPGAGIGVRFRDIGTDGIPGDEHQIMYGMHTMCRPRVFGHRTVMWSNLPDPDFSSIQDQSVLLDIYSHTGDAVYYAWRGSWAKPINRASQWSEGESNFYHVGDTALDGSGYMWSTARILKKPTGNPRDTENRTYPAVYRVKPYSRGDMTFFKMHEKNYAVSGIACSLDGDYNPEAGFLFYPDRRSKEAFYSTTATSVMQTRTYAYRATYEYIDRNGLRSQSSPSLLIDQYATNSCGVRIKFWAYHPTRRHSGTKIVIWRNEALGSSNYYRAGEIEVPSFNSATTIEILDTISDSEVAEGEVLYTVGGRRDWVTPPSSSVACEHGGRIFTAVGDRLYYSNVLGEVVKDDAVSFYEDAYVQLSDSAVGLASFDGAVVAICSSSVFAISGTGPDETDDGQFNEPWRLQTGIGGSAELGGQRSVCVTPKGIVFRSSRGIELIRYGWSSTLISEEVSEELDSYPYVVSVVVDEPRGLVKFLCAASLSTSAAALMLVWNYQESDAQSGRSPVWVWTVETVPLGAYCLAQDGTETIIGSDDQLQHPGYGAGHLCTSIYRERPSVEGDWLTRSAPINQVAGTAYADSSIRLGRFHPGGDGGFGRVRRVALYGEKQNTTTVTIKASFDDGATFEQGQYVSAASAVGEEMIVQYRMERQRGHGIVFEVSDSGTPYSGSGTGGVYYSALTLDYESLPGGPRLPLAQRIG